MFDEILEEEVNSSFTAMKARVEASSGCIAVAVQRGGKHRAWLTECQWVGRRRQPLSQRQQQVKGIRVIRNEVTARVLKYVGVTNVSRVGRHFFRRRRGVAMGSTQSPAKSGVVYRAKERRFLTCTDPSQDAWKLWGLEKLRNTGIPLRRVAMMTRIADDDATHYGADE